MYIITQLAHTNGNDTVKDITVEIILISAILVDTKCVHLNTKNKLANINIDNAT